MAASGPVAMDTTPPASDSGTVVARRQVCEYGLLPVQSLLPKLDHPPAVLAVAHKLLERATLDPSGQHYVISTDDTAAVLGLCENATKIILDTFQAITPDIPGEAKRRPGIRVHSLVLFLFIQLHSRQGTLANTTEVWPSHRDLECHEAPLSPTRSSSPRAARGAKKGKHQQNRKWFQEQLQHHLQHLAAYPIFIRRHLRHLMLLVLNKIPKGYEAQAGATISAPEFDRLGLLLKAADPSQAQQPLSHLIASLLNNGSADISVVEQWLLANTAGSEEDSGPSEAVQHIRSSGMSSGTGTITQHPGLVEMNGIVKSTVVKGEDMCPNGELRVSDCHDMVLYALSPLQMVSVFGCSDATVVIGEELLALPCPFPSPSLSPSPFPPSPGALHPVPPHWRTSHSCLWGRAVMRGALTSCRGAFSRGCWAGGPPGALREAEAYCCGHAGDHQHVP